MTDTESIFEDGENLQSAVAKALQEKKALLCFVCDDGDESAQWEGALLDLRIRDKLRSGTVALRLKAGSEQAGYLNAVCPVQSCPAVIVIFNAQVVANYQHGQTSLEQLQQQLGRRYGTPTEGDQRSPSAKPVIPGYIELAPSEGRMRLPNNAYDHFRKLTEQYLSSGVSGKGLLHIQLTLLESLNIDVVNVAVKAIREQADTTMEPDLPEEVTDRLLNSPASKMKGNATPSNEPPAAPSSSNASISTLSPSESRAPQPASNTRPPQPQPASLSHSQSQPQAQHNPNPQSPHTPTTSSTSSSSAQSQRTAYIASQKHAETERTRIKSQIEADKKARREADRQVREEALAHARRTQLSELRKANSTTSDPKHTDVRIQVRLFDGATIRSSFAAEATIANDVRPWVDGEVRQKAAAVGQGAGGQPYNLKLILTPLPTRQIEAGEEDQALSDIEGVKGSATMVMVPVKGYVESYSVASGGVAGTVQNVVGTGVGLVGSAAGMLFGGIGRLLGAGAALPRQQLQGNAPSASGEGNGAVASWNQAAGNSGSGSARANTGRVRTLADQRQDEEDEQKKRGTQLYNGMGLNVQPRKNNEDDQGGK